MSARLLRLLQKLHADREEVLAMQCQPRIADLSRQAGEHSRSRLARAWWFLGGGAGRGRTISVDRSSRRSGSLRSVRLGGASGGGKTSLLLGILIQLALGINFRSSSSTRKARPPDLATEIRSRIGRLVPLSQPGSFSRAIRTLSGIASFHLHRCGHHYAIDWLGRGGNLKALSLSLGHIGVTERYAQMSDDFVREEARHIAVVRSEL